MSSFSFKSSASNRIPIRQILCAYTQNRTENRWHLPVAHFFQSIEPILPDPVEKCAAGYGGPKTSSHNAVHPEGAGDSKAAVTTKPVCIRHHLCDPPIRGSGTHNLLISSRLLYRCAKDSYLGQRCNLMNLCAILHQLAFK